MDYQTSNNPYWEDEPRATVEPPAPPTHEFYCHNSGEIFETSQPFYYCPSCGEALEPLNLNERHGLAEI